MSLTIKDHDHDKKEVERRESDKHDGSTIKEECTDPECEYYIYRWQPLAKLTDFGGSA